MEDWFESLLSYVECIIGVDSLPSSLEWKMASFLLLLLYSAGLASHLLLRYFVFRVQHCKSCCKPLLIRENEHREAKLSSVYGKRLMKTHYLPNPPQKETLHESIRTKLSSATC